MHFLLAAEDVGTFVCCGLGVIVPVGIYIWLKLREMFKQTRCDLCGSNLGKKSRKAQIEGKSMLLCGRCASNIESRMSRNAVSKLFDDE